MAGNNNYIKKRKSMESITEEDSNSERPTRALTPFKRLSTSSLYSSSPRSFVNKLSNDLFKKPSTPPSKKKQQESDNSDEELDDDYESTSSRSDSDEDSGSSYEQISLLDEIQQLKQHLENTEMKHELLSSRKEVKYLKKLLSVRQKEIEKLKEEQNNIDCDDEEGSDSNDDDDEEEQKDQIVKLEINEEDDNSEFALRLYNKINDNYNFYRTTSIAKGGFKVQEEFVKFIVLKIMDQDYESINCDQVNLVAPPLIENFWKTLALNTKEYQKFLNVVGADIHFCYDIDNKLKRTKKSKSLRIKYVKTLSLYEKYFPEFVGRLYDDKIDVSSESASQLPSPTSRKDENSPIWSRIYLASTIELNEYNLNNSIDSVSNVADSPKSTLFSSVSPSKSDSSVGLSTSQSNVVLKEQTASSAKEIVIFVKTQAGKTESITIEQNATTERLYERVKDRLGVSDINSIVLMIGNKRIVPNGNTIIDYNIQKESTLLMNFTMPRGH